MFTGVSAQIEYSTFFSSELNFIFEKPILTRPAPPPPEADKTSTYYRGGYQFGLLAKRHIGERFALRTGLGFTQVNYQSGRAGFFFEGERDIRELVQPITGNIVAISVDYKQIVLPVYIHMQKKGSNQGPYIGASVTRSFDLNKRYHSLAGTIFPFVMTANAMLNSLIYYPNEGGVFTVVPEIGYSFKWKISPRHAVVFDPYIKQAFQRRYTEFRRMTTLGLRLSYQPNFTKA